MIKTESDLRSLKPFEFQNWVIDAIHGTHAPRKSADMGIDGYTFLERLPVQVKQTEKVERPDIDSFQTAFRREGKHRGYVIGFQFTSPAYGEVARAEREDDIEIELVEVSAILEYLASDHDAPLRRGLSQLTVELIQSARRAAQRKTAQSYPVQRTASELVASAAS